MPTLDLSVFAIYCTSITSIGLWVSKEKSRHQKDGADYYLAGKFLPCWGKKL